MSRAEQKPVRIWFTDQPNKVPEPHPLLAKLLPSYVLDPKDPEIIFYGPFGDDYRTFSCVRVFDTGENVRPDFNYADYAISFDHFHFDDRLLRVPIWVQYQPARELLAQRQELTMSDLAGREFCLTVVSNGQLADPVRDRFFHALHAQRPVASMGRHLGNDSRLADAEAAGVADPKLSFQHKFLFSLAFENSSSPGYVTEKILEAFALGTIPIYWGDPLVARDFNPAAFVNRMDFPDDDSCIAHVLELAADPDRLLAMLNAPIYAEPDLPERYEQQLRDFLAAIFARSPETRGRRVLYGRAMLLEHIERSLWRKEQRRARKLRGFRGRLVRLIERI